MWALLGLICFGALLYLLAPAEVNGDGVGYLKRVSDGGLAPGHLAYLPLARGIAALWPHDTLLELVAPLRLLSLACALGSLVLLHDAARRFRCDRRAATVAVALFGLSHAFIRSAVQIETYAPATLAAVAVLWSLVRHRDAEGSARHLWALLAGLLVAAATLMHLTLILLTVPLLVVLPRRGGLASPAVALAATGLALAGALAATLAHEDLGSPAAAWAWLGSSDHGIPDPHGWSAPLVAAWGAARALVHVPYPHQASPLLYVPLTVVAVLTWILLVVLARRARAAVDWLLLLSWSVPLVLFAVVFFPSDTERWIFVLPVVALVLFPSWDSRATPGLLVLMALVNLGLAQLPAALDRAPLDRARAAERVARGGALVVSPGHGWAELVGLGSTDPPGRFPLIYHVGARGGLEPAVGEMHARIAHTLRSGAPVFVARIDDRVDPRGFKELRWYGLTAEGFAGLFARYRLRPTSVPQLLQLERADERD